MFGCHSPFELPWLHLVSGSASCQEVDLPLVCCYSRHRTIPRGSGALSPQRPLPCELISSGESSANTAATPSCQPFRKPPPDRWSPSQAPGALGCPQRMQTGCSCLTLPPTHGRAAPEKVDMWWAGLGPLEQLEDILFRDKPHAWALFYLGNLPLLNNNISPLLQVVM